MGEMHTGHDFTQPPLDLSDQRPYSLRRPSPEDQAMPPVFEAWLDGRVVELGEDFVGRHAGEVG